MALRVIHVPEKTKQTRKKTIKLCFGINRFWSEFSHREAMEMFPEKNLKKDVQSGEHLQ